VTQHVSARSLESQSCEPGSSELAVTLPALSCVLLEGSDEEEG
jgi:hypothetical protein